MGRGRLTSPEMGGSLRIALGEVAFYLFSFAFVLNLVFGIHLTFLSIFILDFKDVSSRIHLGLKLMPVICY